MALIPVGPARPDAHMPLKVRGMWRIAEATGEFWLACGDCNGWYFKEWRHD